MHRSCGTFQRFSWCAVRAVELPSLHAWRSCVCIPHGVFISARHLLAARLNVLQGVSSVVNVHLGVRAVELPILHVGRSRVVLNVFQGVQFCGE